MLGDCEWKGHGDRYKHKPELGRAEVSGEAAHRSKNGKQVAPGSLFLDVHIADIIQGQSSLQPSQGTGPSPSPIPRPPHLSSDPDL